MTADTTLKILRDFLQERTEINPSLVVPEATLEELGIDSLMQLELLFEFEEKLGISLPDVGERPKTIADLVSLVDMHVSTQATGQ